MNKLYVPQRDGVDHINIHLNSRTTLGKLLSNATKSYFHHPEYGRFASVEGFRYWLLTGKRVTELRTSFGHYPKTIAEAHPPILLDEDEYYDDLRAALRAKFDSFATIRQQMRLSEDLPFVSYNYFFNPDVLGVNPHPTVEVEDSAWYVDEWERIRDRYLEGLEELDLRLRASNY